MYGGAGAGLVPAQKGRLAWKSAVQRIDVEEQSRINSFSTGADIEYEGEQVGKRRFFMLIQIKRGTIQTGG